MRRKSITFRMAVLFAGTSTLVLLAVGAMIGYLVGQHFEHMDLAELSGKMELIRHSLEEVRTEAELQELPKRLEDALIGHEGLSVMLVGSDRKILFATPGADFPADLLGTRPGNATGNALRPISWERAGHPFRGIVAEARAGIPGLPPFKVLIALDLEHHADFTTAFRETLWTSVAVGILLTSLLAWFIARRGLAPVRAIAAVSKGISAERLQNRLAVDTLPVELVDVAESFNDMLSRLEDSFRRLSDFSSDIAHELRTPVSNLATQTQVALSKLRSADEYREVLYSNLEEYDRLTRMISDMLFIAKADNGLIVPRREQIDVGAEIDGLIDFYQVLAEEKQVTLLRIGSGWVLGDKLMIRRAISNLLSNAIRHATAGSKVVARAESGGSGDTRIAIENSGDRIPPEHLPRLFDRFYRIDPSRHRISEGSGLGLAIVKSIVEAHGGKLSATSADGSTVFSIAIPHG